MSKSAQLTDLPAQDLDRIGTGEFDPGCFLPVEAGAAAVAGWDVDGPTPDLKGKAQTPTMLPGYRPWSQKYRPPKSPRSVPAISSRDSASLPCIEWFNSIPLHCFYTNRNWRLRWGRSPARRSEEHPV